MPSSDRPWNDAGEPGGGQREVEDGRSGSVSRTGWIAALALLCTVAVGLALLGAAFVYSITTIGCACQPEAAQVSFDWEYHPANGTVVGTHDGGDELTPDNTGRLEIHVGDELVGTVGLPFSTGDQFEVEDVESGRTVRVVWESADGERTQVIAQYVSGEE